MDFWIGVAVSVAFGLIVNETCELSPWIAKRIVRYAARLWAKGQEEGSATYSEEWAAVVEDAPGKLTKLFVACRFLTGSVSRYGTQRLEPVKYFCQQMHRSFPLTCRAVALQFTLAWLLWMLDAPGNLQFNINVISMPIAAAALGVIVQMTRLEMRIQLEFVNAIIAARNALATTPNIDDFSSVVANSYLLKAEKDGGFTVYTIRPRRRWRFRRRHGS